jgi:hypothetical protein
MDRIKAMERENTVVCIEPTTSVQAVGVKYSF